MKRIIWLLLLVILAQTGSANAQDTGAMPLHFVENVGQFPEAVRFQVDSDIGRVWLTDDGFWVNKVFYGVENAGIQPHNPLPVNISYYQGNDKENWYQVVPVWETVSYQQVIPNVNLVMTSHGGQFTYFFEDTNTGEQVKMPASLTNSLPPLAPAPLPASPPASIAYSTYFGGALTDQGNDIAYDNKGNVYLTGYTSSTTFPALDQTAHGIDVIIAKLKPDNSTFEYIIHINPTASSAEDYGFGIAVDSNEHAYVVGTTNSSDFPTTTGAYNETYNGDGDAFLLKVEPDGSAFTFSTFLGGNDFDSAQDVVVASNGAAMVVGGSWSTNFLSSNTVGTIQQRNIFMAKISSDGSTLQQGLLIGGDKQEEAKGVAMDNAGNLFITGWTFSNTGFPTAGSTIDTTHNGGVDAFLLKINMASNSIAFATFLGGSDEDRANGIAIDSAGAVYVTGLTRSVGFPTTGGAYDTTHGGGTCSFAVCLDAFVSKVTNNGTTLAYSTFLGGSNEDAGIAITQYEGEAIVTGSTWSSNFPTTAGAVSSTRTGDRDAFVAQLNTAGSALLYGSYLGGAEWEEGRAVAVDHAGIIYLSGHTNSTNFHTTPTAYDETLNGDYDAFLTKLNAGIHTHPALVPPELIGAPSPFVATTLNLSWQTQDVVCGYQLYHDTTPYFPLDNTTLFKNLAYTATTTSVPLALGNANIHHFYSLQANACGANTATSSVGEFEFTITPGT
jgi:hypothetical protein